LKELVKGIIPTCFQIKINQSSHQAVVSDLRIQVILFLIVFSGYVNNFCSSKNLPFPEYLIEKQNDVYICKAINLKHDFTSKYHFNKEDAKEDTCRKIYVFITEKYNINNTQNTRVNNRRQDQKPRTKNNSNQPRN
jgi:hypothetical protein